MLTLATAKRIKGEVVQSRSKGNKQVAPAASQTTRATGMKRKEDI